MLIREIIGQQTDMALAGYEIDTLKLEWYELNKRVQRKVSEKGRDVALKFMAEAVALKDGDVLFVDHSEKFAIVVATLETDVIVLSPSNMLEMATICYEIGNKHMPLFIENDEILLPYEAPMFKWLESAGYNPEQQTRKLLNRLKSKVSDHKHVEEEVHRESLFTKVINFAAKNSQ